MPLSPQEIWAIQQQRSASRGAQNQQAQAQQQDWAMQQYAQQLAQWQYQQQLAQQQADREYMKEQQGRADKLSQDYQSKVDQANQKNEQRYLDILEGRYGTRDRVLGDLQNYGQSQKDDANQRYKSVDSQMKANVYSRGFGGSPSMLNSATRSAEQGRDLELNRINDDIINRRTQADASQSEGIHGFMERRNDVPPDLNQLIQLQQGLGRSGPYLSAPTPAGFGGGYGGPPQFGGNNYQPMPMLPGNVNRNYQPAPQAGANWMPNSMMGGGFAQESLPGSRPPMSMQPSQGASVSRYGGNDGGMAELARRNAMANYNQATNSQGSAFGRMDEMQRQQQLAIMNGTGNWSPQQTMPLIPGMAGGPMGAGNLLPSLPENYGGGGYGGRVGRNYGSGMNPNYQRRIAAYGNHRRTFMNSPDYGVSEFMRNNMYPGSRPNPGAAEYYARGG